jgi:hypothetical protein
MRSSRKARDNYAFVAMAMIRGLATNEVLAAIKMAARRCGVRAERIDDQQTNEAIRARIRHSIARACVVIVDLTHERGNVYFEAGIANGLRKTVIYLAFEGTKIPFDLQDYPIIFFRSIKHLKKELIPRLRAVAA